MVKFNNSLAFQNLGASVGLTSSVVQPASKSRNGNVGNGITQSFKTTASITSNKTYDNRNHPISSEKKNHIKNNKQALIVTSDTNHGTKRIVSKPSSGKQGMA